MLGLSRRNWFSYTESRKIINLINIAKVIASRKRRWAGHVSRREDLTGIKGRLGTHPEKKRGQATDTLNFELVKMVENKLLSYGVHWKKPTLSIV